MVLILSLLLGGAVFGQDSLEAGYASGRESVQAMAQEKALSYGPCQESRGLDATGFFFMLTPPNKRAPLTATFLPESCEVFNDGENGLQAVRTYRGNKDYDLVLVTDQSAPSTRIHLVQRLKSGARMMAGSMGAVETLELLRGPVRMDGKSVQDFSAGSSLEGQAELMPKRLTP
ncbi:MAG: hypothetical protein WC728_18010 [Elusimicrobiota bacterium]